jgi:cephalosporin-C deacetylase
MNMKPVDFDEYWSGVLGVVERCAPVPRVTGWELEDPAFEGEYILDGSIGAGMGVSQGAAVPKSAVPNPFDFRWNSRAIATGFTVKKILFRSHDGQEVGGLLQYPKTGDARRFPGIVHFTGYGGELMIDPDFVSSGYAVLNFSHRGMLLGSEGFDRYAPVPLLVRDVENRERYVYRSIVIDCLLALKVMAGFGVVDPGRIAVMGMSQGGALALMASALDGRVKALSCELPWLTDFEWQLAHAVEGPYNELKEFFRRFPGKREEALATLGYFDTLNFADRVNRPAVVSLGREDRVCSPESVRKLFATIGAAKVLLEVPGIAHERSTIWRFVTQRWFDFYL